MLNQTTRDWYSTGSGSDRAPFGECVSVGARSLPLPVLYHRIYQCCLVRFRISKQWVNVHQESSSPPIILTGQARQNYRWSLIRKNQAPTMTSFSQGQNFCPSDYVI